jgi:type IV secretory pathway component VirB8
MTMPTIFVRWMLFVSSYFPLAVIFWIFLITQQPIWAWSVLGIGTLGVVLSFIYIGGILPGRSPVQVTIETQKSRDSEVMGYVASYIIPFVTFPFNGWQQASAVLVFLFVLGVVYVNSEMLCINPMLNLLGYRVYEITVEHSTETYALITRRQRRLKHNDVIRVIDAGRGILLEKIV